jgi:hypothetical protein
MDAPTSAGTASGEDTARTKNEKQNNEKMKNEKNKSNGKSSSSSSGGGAEEGEHLHRTDDDHDDHQHAEKEEEHRFYSSAWPHKAWHWTTNFFVQLKDRLLLTHVVTPNAPVWDIIKVRTLHRRTAN